MVEPERFLIAARSARAFRIDRGQRVRIIEVDGPQVADVNIYGWPDTNEYFSAGATRRLRGGIHVGIGDGLISNPGRERVLMRIVGDTVDHTPGRRGARAHCVILPRCTRAIYEVWAGATNHSSCQEQLTAALEEFGLGPDDTHDTLNLFQKVGVDDDGSIFIEEPDARQGDFVELQADVDCLLNVSSCPADAAGGGLAVPVNSGVPKGLAIEILT